MSEIKAPPTCGIIMPISEIDGCSAEHWADVRTILEGAIEGAGMKPRLVSDAPEVGVIQTRIIGNILNDEMVVCDVSGRNPNVMFELGLRIAFDKPVVIVKDDVTDYSFDTMPMEHLRYPRDLRFGPIVAFKAALADKIKATADVSPHKTYLQSLGPIRVAAPETVQVGEAEMILDEIRSLQRAVSQLRGAPIKVGVSSGEGKYFSKEIFVPQNTSRASTVKVENVSILTSEDVAYLKDYASKIGVEFEYDEDSSFATMVGLKTACERVSAEAGRRVRRRGSSNAEKKVPSQA